MLDFLSCVSLALAILQNVVRSAGEVVGSRASAQRLEIAFDIGLRDLCQVQGNGVWETVRRGSASLSSYCLQERRASKSLTVSAGMAEVSAPPVCGLDLPRAATKLHARLAAFSVGCRWNGRLACVRALMAVASAAGCRKSDVREARRTGTLHTRTRKRGGGKHCPS